jgi:RimJ/RimL family protein N-acetyltransferase
MTDPETTRFNSWGLFPYTPVQMEAFVKTIEHGDSAKIVWAIEVAVTELADPIMNFPNRPSATVLSWIHVGNISLQSINWLNRSAELAVVIGEAEARGVGVGRQACQWVVDHAFLRLALHRVWTGTAATNTAMQKTCAGIGMAQEGRFKHGMFLGGAFVDVLAYGITSDEYFAGIKEIK